MMAWYPASMVLWLVQVHESGSPLAPPEETITEAPSDFAVEISGSVDGSLPTGRVSPQISCSLRR